MQIMSIEHKPQFLMWGAGRRLTHGYGRHSTLRLEKPKNEKETYKV